jgi:hypothetical protein
MKPNADYIVSPPEFWALVRYASEQIGYSTPAKKGRPKSLRRFTSAEIDQLSSSLGIGADIGHRVTSYLNYRADVLEQKVQGLLMNRNKAEKLFRELKRVHHPTCNLPKNKQKGKKKHHAYFTCIVNTLTQANLNGRSFVDNPRQLTTVRDSSGKLVMTLSRQIDGAYPTLDNPVAIWEVKEYYGTTTFGSRVADGVYETQLDGYEINQAMEISGRRIEHYLLVDDSKTWWEMGRSYLCRLVDTMHMGLVDEVIFGREVITRWPEIIGRWP